MRVHRQRPCRDTVNVYAGVRPVRWEEAPVRAALIGCGNMSRTWLRAALAIEGLTIVGLADLDRAAAIRLAGEFGLDDVAIAGGIDELLALARPDILFDVVVPAARHAVVRRALAAGCHVLSEKPLADTLEHAVDLVAAAADAGRVHAVMQNRRYVAGIRRLRRLIDAGALGDIDEVHCDFFKAPHFGGFREQMDHVLLLDMAIHSFDAARLLAGSDPANVMCREGNPRKSWYRAGASAAAVFSLPEGGVITYRGSWCANGLQTEWDSAWRIIGTRGSATWDGADRFAAEIVDGLPPGGELFAPLRAVPVPTLEPSDRIGGHAGVLRDFIDALRSGGEPETSSRRNFASLAMVLAAIESAEQQRPCELPRLPIELAQGHDA
ncbi:Gfo/Idh/MocA family oxidoreductase [Lichenicoccus roseus]|uniref:Gfo/Idh/MocA family oxidoreductase n=2 Tax=Lichenicoccus roseus TaxID=2683649 RepID=A0A5R9J9I8_9PROT|nr:Gfo/Idh/MocA family oxidoreductase [Lichenicoccus roseus]TLU72261.1 Gfo/Idh/MocA family oxidoreductase [Lichenicoccus roseus]